MAILYMGVNSEVQHIVRCNNIISKISTIGNVMWHTLHWPDVNHILLKLVY